LTVRRIPLWPAGGDPFRVLAIGAHPDDIEIGCGGTILRLLEERPDTVIDWLVLSGRRGERAAEARDSAAKFVGGSRGTQITVADLPDGRFPAALPQLKDLLEAYKSGGHDLVLAPWSGDAHQDHRSVGEAAWQTFRDHLIAEYEIPKYDGDLGRPNLYVGLSDDLCRRKIDLLMESFPSQRGRSWYTPETFRAILRIRGVESGTAYGEGFHCRKIVV
jgi:LmbE family N-acetylglucosaminyl deacetylase